MNATVSTPAQLVERELRVIERLKRQRADVRRSKTSLEDLLLGETRDIGKTLQADLAKAESAITDKLNEAWVRLRSARLWEQVRSEAPEFNTHGEAP